MLTAAEVALHNKETDGWLIYDNKVYDVTEWIRKHPGGPILLQFLGTDATDEMLAFHPPAVLQKYLPIFCIGAIEVPVTAVQRDFRSLGAYFERMGYCQEPRFSYGELLLFWCCVMVLFYRQYLLLAACCLGLFWQQTAFLCHDIGHARGSNWIGYGLGSLLSGTSLAWWKSNHYTHHAFTNSAYHDPDINHLPIFAVDRKFFDSVYCTYHQRHMIFGELARFWVSHQHLLYYPLMAVSRVNLYAQSLLFRPCDRLGVCLQLGFFGWYFFLLSQLPIGMALLVHFISHAVAGMLHVQITLSHFARPVTYGVEKDFFSRNVHGSMDIRCHKLLDWFHGGLQFQTAHHAFPRVRRQHLRAATFLVQALCQKHKLPYLSLGFLAANLAVYRKLRSVAQEAKQWKK